MGEVGTAGYCIGICIVDARSAKGLNVILNSSFFSILDALSIWISGDAIGCMNCWEDFSFHYILFRFTKLIGPSGYLRERAK